LTKGIIYIENESGFSHESKVIKDGDFGWSSIEVTSFTDRSSGGNYTCVAEIDGYSHSITKVSAKMFNMWVAI